MENLKTFLESGLVSLALKTVRFLGWAAILWALWSGKTIALNFVESHPVVVQLKAEVAAEKASVILTQATVAQMSDSLARLERVVNQRFDEQVAAINRVQERVDRHMEASHRQP